MRYKALFEKKERKYEDERVNLLILALLKENKPFMKKQGDLKKNEAIFYTGFYAGFSPNKKRRSCESPVNSRLYKILYMEKERRSNRTLI